MRRSLAVLSLVQCVAVLGYSIVLPAVPEIGARFGLGAGGAGFVLAAHAAAMLAGGIVLLRMSERWGRKAVLVGAGLLMAESLLVLAWAGDVFMLFLARIAAGFAGGAAIVAEASAADLRARELPASAGGWPLTRGGYGLGFVLGALLVGLLGGVSGAAPAYAAALLAVLTLVAVVSMLPETGATPVRPAEAAGATRRTGLSSDPVRRLLAISDGAYTFGLTLFVSSFALIAARRFGVSLPMRGYLLAFAGLAAVTADTFGVERLSPSGRRLGVLLAGAVGSAAMLYAWPMAPSIPLLVATVGLAASGVGLGAGSTWRLREQAGMRHDGAAGSGGSLSGWMRVVASLAATLLVAGVGEQAPGALAALVLAALAVYVAATEARLRAAHGRAAPTP